MRVYCRVSEESEAEERQAEGRRSYERLLLHMQKNKSQ
jgi:hypothetical protein